MAVGTASVIEPRFTRVAPLRSAGPGDVSFLDNRRDTGELEQTTAGAVIVHPHMQAHVPGGTIAIVTAATYEGWARVAALFHPAPPPTPWVHPSALVDPTLEWIHLPRSVLAAVFARMSPSATASP